MEDRFQLLSGFGIAKHNVSQGSSVEVAVVIKYRVTENVHDLLDSRSSGLCDLM